jgi:hypothetical protein
VTKRYNRVINRAVMDETFKRFLTKGRTDLESLETRLNDIEDERNSGGALLLVGDAKSQLKRRYAACERLGTDASIFSRTMEAEKQPMKRLTDAITVYQKTPMDEIASISTRMDAMNIAIREPDNQITLGALLINIKAREVALRYIMKVIDSDGYFPKLKPSLTEPSSILTRVLKDCRDLIIQADKGSLSRIVITATITFARIAQLETWYRRTHLEATRMVVHLKENYTGLEKVEDLTETTRDLLAAALKLCDELGNCPELKEQVQEISRLYEGPRYEKVTLEELQSIKTAMVSGRGGIATHSGHWYNCVRGHPVSKLPNFELPSAIYRDKQAERFFF